MTTPDAEIAKSRREVLDRHPSPEVRVSKLLVGWPIRRKREFRYEVVFRCHQVFDFEDEAKHEGMRTRNLIEQALKEDAK